MLTQGVAEDVLDACIEPPGRERVIAAIESLQLVGALDGKKDLTALGQILLKLPVDVALGKMLLLAAFFRCLDPMLDLASIVRLLIRIT